MLKWLINGMIFLGSALMVRNIVGFIRYGRYVREQEEWGEESRILLVPIFLLVMFLAGYLAVGLFGRPDLIVAGILFGGSIFVYIVYWLFNRITRRIIESERLEAKLRATEESSRAKTEFLAGVSHEMRTPMNVILGLDNMALNNPDLPDVTRDQLEKIGRSGRHLLSLINNTLDLQQIDSGEPVIRQSVFPLGEAISQLDAIIATICAEKGLDWRIEIAPDAEGAYFGDEMLIKQILLDLLDNAVKYTDVPGSVTLRVEREQQSGERCVLSFAVADTGIGISPEFLPKVFEVFSREDTSFSSRYSGSGLGLAVARKRARLLGGDITAVSEKGTGSTFTLRVPLETVIQEEKADDAPALPEIELEGRRILIVEDIPENAEIAADLLELEGAETEGAENGQIALNMFRESEPYTYDAILMDLRMPMMDGLEATRCIRALDRGDARSVPIIAVTANANETDVRNSLDAGMNAHLPKPIDAELLYKTLTYWMRKDREGRKET